MSATTTMPASVFALRTSAFNAFLYAPVGEEENGMVLTALSALARLGVDPWDEAARLSALPKETATTRLTSIISAVPHGQWAASTVGDIAARLAALLPGTQAPATQRAAGAASRPALAVAALFLVLFLANALASSLLHNRGAQPSNDQDTTASSSASRPDVPLP